MYRVLACIRDQHNYALVALAAAVCLIACLTAVVLVRRAQSSAGRDRMIWIGTGAVSVGLGIWATHFIAMLAYDPGLVWGYDLALTLVSFLLVTGMAGGGIALAVSEPNPLWRLVGGATLGLGIAAMHYTGMMALQMPGYIEWSADLVAASVLLGMALGAAALWTATGVRNRLTFAGGAGLLTAAIVAHHFTGMAATVIMPDPAREIGGVMMSPHIMSTAVATVTVVTLMLSLIAVAFGQRIDALLLEKERHFRVLVEAVSDYAIYMLDPNGIVSNWNLGAQRFKGYTAEEIVGRSFDVFYTEAQRRSGKPKRALAIALEKGRYEDEGLRVRKDGSTFYANVVITPICDAEGSLIGFAKVTRDVTQRKADRERLSQLTRNLDAALKNMSQGLCLFDVEERLILSNPRMAEIFDLEDQGTRAGMTLKSLLRLAMSSMEGFSELRLQERYEAHRALIAQPGGGQIISELLSGRVLSITHKPLPEGGWVTTLDDITERRRDEERIKHMARHDGLTGLPNRDYFISHLDRELEWAPREGFKIAALSIDLDRFKEINDLRGHAAGDKVLRTLAQRLKDTLEDGEFVARIGGDEFAAVKRFKTPEDLKAFIARLHQGMTSPVDIEGYDVSPGASMGVAVYPDDARRREVLVNNADLALYRAKSTLKEPICFYEARMDEAARDRRAMVKDLGQALEKNEFTLHYQVQKSVTTDEITGYEALLRWHHPVRGHVSPADFIPVAEDSGAIIEIGEWVLRTACYEAARWPSSVNIAVNLSPVQFGSVDLVRTIHEILIETGLSPHRLELEITESSIIGDKMHALHIFRQIKALGVTIAIDDFGTGYSSLDTLNSFPFDKIKIDRSFLIASEQSPQARAIIRAILALGKSLEVPVLAEGVETLSQLKFLLSEGCDEAQGYFLGRPAALVPEPKLSEKPATEDAATPAKPTRKRRSA